MTLDNVIPLGFDLGGQKSVIAVVRKNGVDVLVNDVSNRSTPSLVGFTDKNRLIGESAQTRQAMNVVNTVGNLNRLLTSMANDENHKNELKYTRNKIVSVSDGQIGVEVEFQGKKHIFTGTQLLAMYCAKLKNLAQKEIGNEGTLRNVCVTVPVWFTELERYQMIDSLKIAGLRPVCILNNITAAGVCYVITRNNQLPNRDDSKPRIVAFIDIGYSTLTCSIMAFRQGTLKVIGTTCDRTFGGRDIDLMIAEHFALEFYSRYNVDVKSNVKSFNRLLKQSENLKKILSANSIATISVDALIDDIDFQSQLTRDELQNLVKPMLPKLYETVNELLDKTQVGLDAIEFVEIIGGSSRVPIFKEALADIFKQPLSTTLNQDESIAKGAAYLCAITTTGSRIFKYSDVEAEAVRAIWSDEDGHQQQATVFEKGASTPASMEIVIERQSDLSLQLVDSEGTSLGKWMIKIGGQIREPSKIHIVFLSNYLGIHHVSKAYYLDKDKNKQALKIKSKTRALDHERIKRYMKLEKEMDMRDRNVVNAEEWKNKLEEYMFSIRNKYESNGANGILEEVDALDHWLYNEGMDTSVEEYRNRYERLQSIESNHKEVQSAQKQNSMMRQRAKDIFHVNHKHK